VLMEQSLQLKVSRRCHGSTK